MVYPHPTATHIRLALHQQEADELGGNLLGRAAKKKDWEVLRGRGGFESGYVWKCWGMLTGVLWQVYKWNTTCRYWRCQKSNSQL